jgi:PAS domain S-box-containing protein
MNHKFYTKENNGGLPDKGNTSLDYDLSSAVKTSSDGIAINNLRREFIYANDALVKICGYNSPEDLIGKSWKILYDDNEVKRFDKVIIPELMKTGFWRGEATGIKRDGSTVFQDVTLSLTKDGRIIRIIRDITKRRNAEIALAESEFRYRSLLENLQDLVLYQDNENMIKYANKQFCDLFGYTPNELIGTNGFSLLFDKNDIEFVNEKNKSREKGISDHYELKLKKKNGDLVWGHIKGTPYYDTKNKVIGSITIISDITEQKKSKEALKESETKYQLLLENLQEAVFYVDNNAIMLLANKQCCEIFGYSMEDLINSNSLELLYDKGDIKYILEKNKLRERGISDAYELRCKKKNGELIWCTINGAPYYNANGKVIGSVTIVNDITKQKRYSDALKDSETKFQAIFESSVDAIGVSKNGINVLINPAFVSLFGYEKKEEMEGKSEADLIAPGELRRILDYTKQRMKGGSAPAAYETIGLKKDGTEFSLEVNVSSYKLKEETYDISILRDITELKIAEKALQESEGQYRKLIDISPDAIIVIDLKSRIQITNQRSAEMLGCDNKEELIGTSYIDLLTEEYKEISRITMQNIFFEGYARNLERKMLRKDGTVFDAEINVSLIKDSSDNPKNLIAIIRDVTARKQIEEQLRKYAEEQGEMNATKDKFYSVIAHDLRSPFQSLLGYSDMLKSSIANLKPEKISSFAKNIYETSSETYNLLEDLLQWTALQTGRIKVNPETIYVIELFNSVIKSFRVNAKKKKIALLSDLTKKLFIYADRILVTTILRNLVSNAIKYTNKKGEIILDAKEKGSKILISVEDTGVGISRKNISRLFKVDSTFTTPGTAKEKGTGLGLIICREFAQLNNGLLSVKSTQGKGSRFKLTLPKKK